MSRFDRRRYRRALAHRRLPIQMNRTSPHTPHPESKYALYTVFSLCLKIPGQLRTWMRKSKLPHATYATWRSLETPCDLIWCLQGLFESAYGFSALWIAWVSGAVHCSWSSMWTWALPRRRRARCHASEPRIDASNEQQTRPEEPVDQRRCWRLLWCELCGQLRTAVLTTSGSERRSGDLLKLGLEMPPGTAGWDPETLKDFGRLLLGCIEADFCNQILILQNCSISTRCTYYSKLKSPFQQIFQPVVVLRTDVDENMSELHVNLKLSTLSHTKFLRILNF